MDQHLLQQALFQIENKNQELAKQESKPSENGDQLEDALADKRINHLPAMPDNTPEEEQDVEIRQSLRYAMLLVGIRAHNMPTKEEKGVIIEFIKKSYGAHTPMELKLAFDLAVNGQLELDDVKCYENFSCEYIGRILKAYRIWAAKEVNWKWSKRTDYTQLEIDAPKEIDWSDRWENVKSIMREEGLKGLNSMIIETPIYDWLVRTGKLRLDPEDKKTIFIKAHQEHILELQAKINDKKGDRQDYEDLAALRVDTWVQNPNLLTRAANISKVIATKELAICEISAE